MLYDKMCISYVYPVDMSYVVECVLKMYLVVTKHPPLKLAVSSLLCCLSYMKKPLLTVMAPQVVLAPNSNQSIWRTELQSGACSTFGASTTSGACSTPTMVQNSTFWHAALESPFRCAAGCRRAMRTDEGKAACNNQPRKRGPWEPRRQKEITAVQTS